jgi:hypothetical protein
MKPRAGCAGVPACALPLLLGAALAAGCHTAAPLPAIDLAAPGWRVQQGQALWKPSSGRPELAGDLLVATNVNGGIFIQFSKTPFPLATAQISGGRWRIQWGVNTFARQGSGHPPDRFAWFQLPRALLGATLAGNWTFAGPPSQPWRLENPRTGETLEGELTP